MSLGSGRCHVHPDRAGIGICVECRDVICLECTTQFEGINRCASCLAKRLDAIKRIAPRREWSAGSVLLALTSFAGLFAFFFALAKVLSR